MPAIAMTSPFTPAGAGAEESGRTRLRFIASSLVAQRLRGIDPGGAARGEVGGDEADRAEDRRRDQADRRGERGLPEELEGLVPLGGRELERDDDRHREEQAEEAADDR